QQCGTIGAEPDRVAIRAEGANRFTLHWWIHVGPGRLARLKAIQALFAPGPDGTIVRRCGAVDDRGIRRPRRVRKRGEGSVLKTLDAPAGSADQQATRRFLCDGEQGCRSQSGVRAPKAQHTW